MALGVALRTGIAHAQIKIPVRSELNKPAAMVLGNTDDFEQPSRRLPGIVPKICRGDFLDDDDQYW